VVQPLVQLPRVEAFVPAGFERVLEREAIQLGEIGRGGCGRHLRG
jgi:hypothetical protein